MSCIESTTGIGVEGREWTGLGLGKLVDGLGIMPVRTSQDIEVVYNCFFTGSCQAKRHQRNIILRGFQKSRM